MSYWNGKAALVTGGSAGLGLAVAQALAEAGAKTAIAARDEARLKLAATSLGVLSDDVLAIPADVTRDDDVQRMVGDALDRFGRLDVLVNAAGKSARGAVLETTTEQFRELWELNFLAAARCTRAAGPALLAARGHVVLIGSLAAKAAAPYLGAYPASKFPLAAYAQQLRLELGPQGLHTLLVCPGPIHRSDAGVRYNDQAANLPASARKPGGGVKLKGILPDELAARILRACERRQPELVAPGKARLLFALAQLWPGWGDWLVRRQTSSADATDTGGAGEAADEGGSGAASELK